MTGADARELLTAARTAQAGTGPGTLADYPIPGGDAHLLIHYAPGSRAYRLKVTSPYDQAPPGHDAGPNRVPGLVPDEPSPGPATPHGGPAGDDGGTPAPGPAGPAADPAAATVTITLWHNIASGAHDRPTGLLDGYQPGHPMVRVFTYQTRPAGRSPEALADEAFAIGNGHPVDAAGQELSRRYYARQLRSLSVGDVVTIGEAPLAVARAGWTRACGVFTEVRADQHGTHPLPGPPANPADEACPEGARP